MSTVVVDPLTVKSPATVKFAPNSVFPLIFAVPLTSKLCVGIERSDAGLITTAPLIELLAPIDIMFIALPYAPEPLPLFIEKVNADS